MSGTGVGRGRGWLNLSKGQNPGNAARPGPAVSPGPPAPLPDGPQFANAPNEYSDLINQVKQLNVNDDGIKFNQKIKYITDNWMQGCLTPGEVENSFDSIHLAALHDPDLASKLVLMVSSRTFLQQKIHDQNIRMMFVKRLQDNYEACMQLQSVDPAAFRTSVQMMGEFYSKARFANGKQMTFMAAPLAAYLEMLVDSGQPLDLRLFAAQLFMNGASIKAEAPEKLAEVMNKVRAAVVDSKTAAECRVWLLLALEVASNRFSLLPSEVHKFYQEQLGDAAMASFQGTHGALSVQTAHNSKTLDGYQSSVNVLQVTTASDSASDHQVSPQPSSNDFGYSSSSGFGSDGGLKTTGVGPKPTGVGPKPTAVGRKENSSGKTGRPILGSGARLNRHKEEAGEVWRDRGEGWGANKKPGGWDKVPPRTMNKGWEHDDRFDTDYS